MTKKEETLANVNEYWPSLIDQEMRNFKNVLHISEETETILRNATILGGEWMQNFHWGPLARMKVRVESRGINYLIKGSLSDSVTMEEIETGRQFPLTVEEEESVSIIMEKGGIRHLLIVLDGENWSPEINEEEDIS